MLIELKETTKCGPAIHTELALAEAIIPWTVQFDLTSTLVENLKLNHIVAGQLKAGYLGVVGRLPTRNLAERRRYMVDVLIDTCLQDFTTTYLQITSQHMLSSSGFCGKAMQWHSLALDRSSNKPSLVFAMDCLRARTHDGSSNLWLRWSTSDVHPGGCVRATYV